MSDDETEGGPASEAPSEHDKHWLVRKSTIRGLWVGLGVVLALTVAAEALVERHPYFDPEELFGFNAWYGFLTCVAMVFVAKTLGLLLKKPDDYYDDA